MTGTLQACNCSCLLTLWACRAAWSPALALLLEDVAGVLFRPSPARRPARPQPAAAAAAPSPAPHPDPDPARGQQPALAAAVRRGGDAGAACGARVQDAASPAMPASLPDAAGRSSNPGSAARPAGSADGAAATSSAPCVQPHAEGAPAAVHGPATAASAAAADATSAAREAATTRRQERSSAPAACWDECAGNERRTQGQPEPGAGSQEAHPLRQLALAHEVGPGLGEGSPAATDCGPDPNPRSGGRGAALVPLQPWQEESHSAASDAVAEELSARIALYSCFLRCAQGLRCSCSCINPHTARLVALTSLAVSG